MKELLRIRKYLNGDMTSQELETFKSELARSSELRAQVALYQLEQQLISTVAGKRIAADVSEAYAQAGNSKQGYCLWWAVAAVALLLAAMFFLYRGVALPAPDARALAIEAYEGAPLTLSSVQRGDSATIGFLSADVGLQSYEQLKTLNKEELQALTSMLLDKAAQSGQAHNTSYLLGHLYFLSGDFQAAAQSFGQVAGHAQPGDSLRSFAEFFQWLSLLAQDHHQEGAQILGQKLLSSPGHRFHHEARELYFQIFTDER